MRFNEVTEQKLHACFEALAHITTKRKLEDMRIKKQQNRNR